ncbi:hypothetical protein ACWDV4_07030 [Micromonospora sp. NPDC003197]
MLAWSGGSPGPAEESGWDGRGSPTAYPPAHQIDLDWRAGRLGYATATASALAIVAVGGAYQLLPW